MAASIRSTSHFVATGSVTSGSVPMPTGWQPGDVMYIISVLASANGTITAPTGYTELIAQFHSSATTSATMELCRRVLQTGDTAPTVTCKSGRLVCIGVAVQGADNTTPEDVSAASDTNSGVTFPSVRAPSVSPTSSSALLITFHGEYEGTTSDSVSFTPDASETEADDQSSAVSGSSNAGVEVAWEALTSSGATGTKTATASTSSTSHGPMGVSVAVRPAATGSTVNLTVAQETVAALTPTLSEQLSLPVAQETIAALAPAAKLSLPLAVAQVNINAPAPTATVGPVSVSLPVARVNVAAPTPSPRVSLTLTTAQVNVAAPAPTAKVQLTLPVAQVSVAARAPSPKVQLGLAVAQVVISAPAPTVTAGGGGGQTASLTTAHLTASAPSPSPQLTLGLARAQVNVAALAPSPRLSLALATAQVAVAAFPLTAGTGNQPPLGPDTGGSAAGPQPGGSASWKQGGGGATQVLSSGSASSPSSGGTVTWPDGRT